MDNGYLVVEGRKKEAIKSAYGEYVQPAKIESMLREIRDVDEAMVLGEGRPYCVALIWVRNGANGTGTFESVCQGVHEANKRLSHPEQLKKWVVLDDDLSVKSGELTPNLKLRRKTIETRLADVIDGLYSGHLPGSVSPHQVGCIPS